MEKPSKIKQIKQNLQPTIREINFIWFRMKKNKFSLLGLGIIVGFAILAIIAPILAPPVFSDPFVIPPPESYLQYPQPPSPKHPFGTVYGYDIYYACIWGTRMAFRVSILVVAISIIIGLVIGLPSGYYGGIIDEICMRFTDIILAFPSLILAMAFAIILPKMGISRLDAVLLAITIVGWPGYARLIRGEVLRVKSEDYVEAAKAIGCSDIRVMIRHILPNTIYPVLIVASLDMGSIVLLSAALSFLGIGAPLGYAEWGQIISLSQNYIFSEIKINPFTNLFVFIIPGIFITLFVLGWNLLGDALRDVLDPMLRRR